MLAHYSSSERAAPPVTLGQTGVTLMSSLWGCLPFYFFFQPFALMQKRWSSTPSERRLCLSRPQTSIIPSHAKARFCKCKRSSRSGEKKKKKPRHACGSDRCLQCGISKNAAVGQRDYKNWFHSWGNPILRLNLRNTEWDMFWLQKWFLFKGNYSQPKPASFYF